MSLIRWQKSEPNVWAVPSFATLHDEINRVFGAHRSLQSAPPAVDFYEDRDRLILKAELPGVNKTGLEVTLEGNTLTFTGRRSEAPVVGTPLYRETRPLNYRRSFELDPSIDTNKIAAEIQQGVLTLTLPKAERVQPRRIEIK
jgi:HSP20 family protein